MKPDTNTPGMVKVRAADGSIVEKPARCSVEGPKVAPCYKLDALLERECSRQSPRVRVGPMVARDHDRLRDGVVLDLGAKNLWFVDYCPFCGASIVTTFPAAAAEGSA